MNQTANTVEDIRVVKAARALTRLDASVKVTLSDWAEYGNGLMSLREQAGINDKEFGRLVKEAGLMARPAQDAPVRADALWLARNWDHLSAVLKDNPCPHSHPQHARQWCRKQGFEWAVDLSKPKKPKAGRSAPIQNIAQALEHSGQPPLTVEEQALLRNGGAALKRDVLNAAGVGSFKELKKVDDEAFDKAIASAAEVIRQARANAGLPDTAEAIKDALPKQSEKEKLDRAIKKAIDVELVALRASFKSEVKKATDARVIEVSAQYDKLIEEAQGTIVHYNAMCADVTTYLTYDEFRLIRSCLHPDREPDETRRRKAFQVFCELEAEINPATPASVLRERGWSHLRGGRK